MIADLDLARFPTLAGHPPSDGAHRLAWWLSAGGTVPPAWASQDLIERLLAGEIEPGDELAATIAAVTNAAVRPEDWRRGGPLGWTDRPFKREG